MMLFLSSKKLSNSSEADINLKNNELTLELDSIKSNTAYISFNSDGIILDANKKFLSTVGYSLDEIVGKHHKIFCQEDYIKTHEYQ
ncbi:Biofilm dispersion protein BdlA [Marinomonas spartinae]|uniref:Biofilm dispersion protein BdlA n=2 Tax=Marinomonas spartinae TaxID=1792290 RepID=A0A1A8T2Q6_9GAMM|nr:PAS domain S-box protein [Marinomonas spartinae]SBS26046.1 Biofilm dispersion protein BdlA [Marinomonas spartinae]